MNMIHFTTHREKRRWIPPPHTPRAGPAPHTNPPWTPPLPMAAYMSPPHLMQQMNLLTTALALLALLLQPALNLQPSLHWRPAGRSAEGIVNESKLLDLLHTCHIMQNSSDQQIHD
jgi:hypothetical protein